MAGNIKVIGMVLSSMNVSDYDRRITILTKDRGKITAFASGAKKPTSTLLACTQPFVFGEFTLYETRTSYKLSSCEVTEYFSELREDLQAIYYGMYFCEFVSSVTEENVDASKELKLLYISLKALMVKSIGCQLVKNIFELKMMQLQGQMPKLYECSCCKTKEDLRWFAAAKDGMICNGCARQVDALIYPASETTLYTMQYIVSSPIEKLYNFTVKPEVGKEFANIMHEYLRSHLEAQLKSEEMIRIVEKF